MAEIVLVFDFDKTILDCDSDDWVVGKLGLSEAFDRLQPTLPYNSLMVSCHYRLFRTPHEGILDGTCYAVYVHIKFSRNCGAQLTATEVPPARRGWLSLRMAIVIGLQVQ